MEKLTSVLISSILMDTFTDAGVLTTLRKYELTKMTAGVSSSTVLPLVKYDGISNPIDDPEAEARESAVCNQTSTQAVKCIPQQLNLREPMRVLGFASLCHCFSGMGISLEP